MAWQSGGGGGFTPNLLVVFCGSLTVPAGSTGTPIVVSAISKAGSAYHAVVGQSSIGILIPGWYSVVAFARASLLGTAGDEYILDEGGAMDFVDGQPPFDVRVQTGAGLVTPQSTGCLLFDGVDKTFQMELSNSGAADQSFTGEMYAAYLGPA